MANQIFRGQSLLVSIDMDQDISAATGQKILFTRPDRTVGEWAATIDGTKLVYEVGIGELDVPGRWQLEGKIYIAGKRYLSGIVLLNVEKSLDD